MNCLQKLPKLKKVRHLTMMDNDIASFAGLNNLRSLPLEELFVIGNPVSFQIGYRQKWVLWTFLTLLWWDWQALGKLMCRRVCLFLNRGDIALVMHLTLSLPWCHLRLTNKSAKFESLSLFVFFFTLVYERIFIKTHNIKSDLLLNPQNMLLAGVFVHFSGQKFYRLGQWRG